MKQIDHKNMSARGFISAAIRVLKSHDVKIAKIPRTSSWGYSGDDVAGAHVSRVGLSNSVSVSWYDPRQRRSIDAEAVRAECKARLNECKAILQAHGVTFTNDLWVECFSA
jgi:hypothetical protein